MLLASRARVPCSHSFSLKLSLSFRVGWQATWKCMKLKSSEILPIEAEQGAKLKWGCYNAAKVMK